MSGRGGLAWAGLVLCGLAGVLRADEAGDLQVRELARRGAEAWKRDDLAGAERAYREALRRSPRSAALHLNLGRVYQKGGDAVRALGACQAGLREEAPANVRAGLESCVKWAEGKERERRDQVARERAARAEAARQEREKAARASAEKRKAPAVSPPQAGAAPRADATAPPGMARIPGGRFPMGSEDGGDDEKPVHWVEVKAFSIDRTEVTADAYAACVKAGRCQAQSTVAYSWNGKGPEFWSQQCNYGKAGRGQHPMNCVDWEQAAAYCRFAGKRLPTEAEWEYAARGAQGRKYPWGEAAPGPTRLNACGEECVAWAAKNGISWGKMYAGDDGWETTAPVGQYPQGATPQGVLDLAGNVWEWVQDHYASCYDSAKCSPDQMRRVLRGASWSDVDPRFARAAGRDGNPSSDRYDFFGFRCAQD